MTDLEKEELFGKQLQHYKDRIRMLEAKLLNLDDQHRIKQLEAALDDLAQYVSRADWHYLKPETIAALEEKKDD